MTNTTWVPGDPVHQETSEDVERGTTVGSLGLCGPLDTPEACEPGCCGVKDSAQTDSSFQNAVEIASNALQNGQSLMVFDPKATSQANMQLAQKILATSDESILMEAERITNGQREKDYGLALDNHERIANLWNGYITNLCESKGYTWATWLLPEDVAAMMVLMKIARIQHEPNRDGLVDIAGYANVISKMIGQRADRALRLAEDVD